MTKTGRRMSAAARQEERAAWMLMAPWFLGVVAVTLGPLLASLYLSFTDYNLLSAPEWVGLENYAEMLRDTRLHKALAVTATYTFVSVPLMLAVALALAMLLNRGIKGLAFYRSVYYLPSLLGGSVAVGVLWRQVFGIEGLVNQFLGLFGIEGPGWIANPDTALISLILLHVWTFGSSMVIFLAGLRQIPEHLYEAAALDGASKREQFRHVTVPMLTPIIFFNMVLGIINSFQTFTQAFVVSGGTGGPSDSTLLYSLYLYSEAFGRLHMGYASAMAWLLVVIVGVLTAINFYFSKRWVFYSDGN
ncbi:sugar ABC transporter permease [Glycomyces luteolus]|uniref:Sugar ABC transporter permease n=1 Tax=Glycomyces luteolus TaxID=2670330 RepID=A0A9X3PPW9_9ACTN|nr:sugar ABC transporter permease [Glycomyces luteolus]MDA1362945.1 sugar ABC transporter permease [Glycomyces luteolus]